MTDRKLPSFYEGMRDVSPNLLGAVFGVASGENDWAVKQLAVADRREGDLPNGVVVFDRGRAPTGDERLRWGTALWNAERGRIVFFSGHYDLDRDDAMKSFAQRVERMTKNPEPGDDGMERFAPLGPDEAELDADLNAEGEEAARAEEDPPSQPRAGVWPGRDDGDELEVAR